MFTAEDRALMLNFIHSDEIQSFLHGRNVSAEGAPVEEPTSRGGSHKGKGSYPEVAKMIYERFFDIDHPNYNRPVPTPTPAPPLDDVAGKLDKSSGKSKRRTRPKKATTPRARPTLQVRVIHARFLSSRVFTPM